MEKKLPTPVDVCLELVQGKLDSITARMILQESYETLFGIFNHDAVNVAKTRPLALVAMHPKENVAEYSKLYRTVVRYKDHNIQSLFGLNIEQFLDQPLEMVELMFKLSVDHIRKDNVRVDAAAKALERQIQH